MSISTESNYPVSRNTMKLREPNLNLFSYTLKHGLGVSEETTYKTYREYLESLSKKVQQVLNITISQNIQQNFLSIEQRELAVLPFTGTLNKHPISGQYCQWTLEDNYQLLLDSYVNESYSESQVIELVKSLKLLTSQEPELGNLGQTWMLSGWLESGSDLDKEDLARKAYYALFKQESEPEDTGIFLGGKVFEFCGENWESDQHLLVFFYPDENATQKAAKDFYIDWLDLLCYRHKILWAYKNSQILKERLLKNYNQIVSINHLEQLNLDELCTTMGKLSEFTISLNYLELQYSTIEVNLEKYDRKLQEIRSNTRRFDNLNFLENFHQKAQEKYPKQIRKDLDNFRPCLEVLRSLTDTIRGTVEIRQAQNDRRFQIFVGIAGIGLGTGGMVASASSNFAKEIEGTPLLRNIINVIPFPPQWSSLKFTLTFSFLSGLSLAILTACIIKILSGRKFRRS